MPLKTSKDSTQAAEDDDDDADDDVAEDGEEDEEAETEDLADEGRDEEDEIALDEVLVDARLACNFTVTETEWKKMRNTIRKVCPRQSFSYFF
jgi:hypothetical protein